ncbi:hypothetical protein DOTSEDRAFT_39653 [Dothistroma septosporum NZE10]|uniref:Uncharacterized protein n=1 Tax=Dothistroma septosporum (strain NZE10 / CBS 128990) TaxID=675120 RepID=M2YHV9_DOTSN|nr:hypothetical protein DOTSEDRAFT_39653 [Dothistroma septosporum NZE10]
MVCAYPSHRALAFAAYADQAQEIMDAKSTGIMLGRALSSRNDRPLAGVTQCHVGEVDMLSGFASCACWPALNSGDKDWDPPCREVYFDLTFSTSRYHCARRDACCYYGTSYSACKMCTRGTIPRDMTLSSFDMKFSLLSADHLLLIYTFTTTHSKQP